MQVCKTQHLKEVLGGLLPEECYAWLGCVPEFEEEERKDLRRKKDRERHKVRDRERARKRLIQRLEVAGLI